MMSFYNNLYGVNVYMLKALKNFDPQGTAIFVIGAIQFLHLGMIIAIIDKLTGFLLFKLLPSKYYILFITIPLILILFKYYSKPKKDEILKKFDEKSIDSKIGWGLISIASSIIPFVLFSILY